MRVVGSGQGGDASGIAVLQGKWGQAHVHQAPTTTGPAADGCTWVAAVLPCEKPAAVSFYSALTV
jgi:hypothetical protein